MAPLCMLALTSLMYRIGVVLPSRVLLAKALQNKSAVLLVKMTSSA